MYVLSTTGSETQIFIPFSRAIAQAKLLAEDAPHATNIYNPNPDTISHQGISANPSPIATFILHKDEIIEIIINSVDFRNHNTHELEYTPVKYPERMPPWAYPHVPM